MVHGVHCKQRRDYSLWYLFLCTKLDVGLMFAHSDWAPAIEEKNMNYRIIIICFQGARSVGFQINHMVLLTQNTHTHTHVYITHIYDICMYVYIYTLYILQHTVYTICMIKYTDYEEVKTPPVSQ